VSVEKRKMENLKEMEDEGEVGDGEVK